MHQACFLFLQQLYYFQFLGKKKEKKIKVCFDKPVHLTSPGLLKRKRKRSKEKAGKEVEGDRKRIRFSNLDSSGCPIDPQFSEDDEDRDQSHVIVDNIIDGLISFVLKN